ncbi:hypothetical protein Lgra_2591 [Legionella gratiana]|uniref:Uncharacterized protein n=1 Tax=Legionella gratiana TaxID=45066 RepID=A0A378JC09_9GAMM|nr:hypothetical protein [Legionella gratiana]KTD05814.1 hypothetical protein Lgra_2591 [Legionella gratiana]STX42150.1 Uncharacterised protein [Legionella gratiana]
MKMELITSKIRPIRKLFIIDTDSTLHFETIVEELSDEIDGFKNIFLLNDKEIWSSINIEFVKRHDPDFIINFSNLEDALIKDHFEIETVNAKTDNFKLSKYGTKIRTFTTKPFLLNKSDEFLPKEIFYSSQLGWEPLSLMASINFGYKKDKEDLDLSCSIFKDINLKPIQNLSDIRKQLLKKNNKFCLITNHLDITTGSSSIYHENFNKEGYFKQGIHIFVSNERDLQSLIYFWNTRATYSHDDLIWIPIELLSDFSSIIKKSYKIIYITEEIRDSIQKIIGEKKSTTDLFKLNRLYFNERISRWKSFEHETYITKSDNTFLVNHPSFKSFSDIGMNSPCIIEVRGWWNLPKRYCLGSIFSHHGEKEGFYNHEYMRVSQNILSIATFPFNPFSSNIYTEFYDITFEQVANKIFQDSKLIFKKTDKSYLLKQLINTLEGIGNIKLICNQEIHNLIKKLSPIKRVEQAIKKSLEHDKSKSTDIQKDLDQMNSIIGNMEENRIIERTPTIKTIDQLLSLKSAESTKEKFFQTLTSLYKNKILLRGKYFSCSHCSGMIWLPLEGIKRKNYCPDCDMPVSIPINANNQTDYFKLNNLVVRAFDQGQVSTLLLMNYINEISCPNNEFLSNILVFDELAHTTQELTDIDLFIKVGSKIGIAECKSNMAFQSEQIKSLITIGNQLKVDFVFFSSFLKKGCEELSRLVEQLKTLEFNYPAFILSQEEIFNPSEILMKYFEISSETKIKPEIIILGKNNKNKLG